MSCLNNSSILQDVVGYHDITIKIPLCHNSSTAVGHIEVGYKTQRGIKINWTVEPAIKPLHYLLSSDSSMIGYESCSKAFDTA